MSHLLQLFFTSDVEGGSVVNVVVVNASYEDVMHSNPGLWTLLHCQWFCFPSFFFEYFPML